MPWDERLNGAHGGVRRFAECDERHRGLRAAMTAEPH